MFVSLEGRITLHELMAQAWQQVGIGKVHRIPLAGLKRIFLLLGGFLVWVGLSGMFIFNPWKPSMPREEIDYDEFRRRGRDVRRARVSHSSASRQN